MIYVIRTADEEALHVKTAPRARRGRGLLYATAPFTIYLLALSILFAWSLADLSVWWKVKQVATTGGLLTFGLCALLFPVGYWFEDELRADRASCTLRHRGLRRRNLNLTYSQVSEWIVEPSLRSLGADLKLCARLVGGETVEFLEGEPHAGQVHAIAEILSRLSGRPVRRQMPAGGSSQT